MGDVSTIGLDIAKSVFQVHGVDVKGAVVIRKRVGRAKVLVYFGDLARAPSTRDRTRPMLQNVRKFLPGRRPHVTQLRHWLCTAAMVLMPVLASIKLLV